MPNKTKKKWISCVCQSSSRFTNNNNYFCIVKLRGSPGHFSALDGLVTPNEKSTNWNGGSISIVCGWLALKPPKTVKSTSGKLSSHKNLILISTFVFSHSSWYKNLKSCS